MRNNSLRFILSILITLGWLILMGCSDAEHSNPYDPENPDVEITEYDFEDIGVGNKPSAWDFNGNWEVYEDDDAPSPSHVLKVTNSSTQTEALAILPGSYDDFYMKLEIKATASLDDKLLKGLTPTPAEHMIGVSFRADRSGNSYNVLLTPESAILTKISMYGAIYQPLTSMELAFSAGEWYAVEIKCEGNEINFGIDGQWLSQPVNNSEFSSGYIALTAINGKYGMFDSIEIYE